MAAGVGKGTTTLSKRGLSLLRDMVNSDAASLKSRSAPGQHDKHIQTIYCERGAPENEESRFQSQIALDFLLASPGNQKRAFSFSLANQI